MKHNSNNKVLHMLLSTNAFVSGQAIAENIGMSRSYVWKAINALKKNGYVIEAITNKGYRLLHAPDILTAERISYHLSTEFIGKSVLCYDSLTSTNDKIKELAFEQAPEGTVVVAKTQTNGRGRRGKEWVSPPGKDIFMSMLLRPRITPSQAPCLTLLAGLCLCTVIREQTKLNATIKWPNDVTYTGQKLCGILTEMGGEMDQVDYVLLGLGINVNTELFPAELNTATSLYKATGKNWSRLILLQRILEKWELYYTSYCQHGSFRPFYSEYIQLCETIGQPVTVIGAQKLNGHAVDITQNGELILRLETGENITIYSGEVSIRAQGVPYD